MCGRYYVDDETAREIEKIVRQVNDKLLLDKKARDVYPSAEAPMIQGLADELIATRSTWGFPSFQGNGVIFNARSETAMEKPMFRESVQERRCIIPATGFYEWNGNKDRYFFKSPNQSILLFAGFYKRFEKENRFVILTTKANESMEEVHSRMPLILEPEEVTHWMFDNTSVEFLLHKQPKPLHKEIQGQMSLLDFK